MSEISKRVQDISAERRLDMVTASVDTIQISLDVIRQLIAPNDPVEAAALDLAKVLGADPAYMHINRGNLPTPPVVEEMPDYLVLSAEIAQEAVRDGDATEEKELIVWLMSALQSSQQRAEQKEKDAYYRGVKGGVDATHEYKEELIAQLEKERDDLLEGFNKDGLDAREACCGQYKQDLADQIEAMKPVVEAALAWDGDCTEDRPPSLSVCERLQSAVCDYARSTQRTEAGT